MALIRPNDFTETVRNAEAQSALAPLASRLANLDPNVRRAAVLELAAQPSASNLLAIKLEEETHPAVVDALINSLGDISDAIATKALIECLSSDDAGLRSRAIEALKRTAHDHCHLIRDALDDDDSDVRILAIGVLESLRHPDIESWLVTLIEQDPHVNVCAAAIDLLCEIGTEKSVDALEYCLGRFPGEAYLQFAGALALNRLRGALPL